MATARRPSSEGLVEAVEQQQQQQQPPAEPTLQASVRGSEQQQQQQQQQQPHHHQTSGWADVEGLPVAHATTASAFAYVGVPIDGGTNDNDNCTSSSTAAEAAGPLLPPPPRHRYIDETAGGAPRGSHGDVGLGVGGDFAGADEHARASARRDNEDFCEKKRFTEAQARSRVAEDLRAIEAARVNAKRRDAEGLDMRPHPGNRLEPAEAGVLGEKAFAFAGGGGAAAGAGGSGAAVAAGKGSEPEEGVSTGGKGGYQCSEYVPAEYVIPEYKSIYGTPPEK